MQSLGWPEQLLLVLFLVFASGLALAGESREGQGRASPYVLGADAQREDVGELGSLRGSPRQPLDGARRGRLLAAGGLDARLGDRAQIADEITRRAVGLPSRPDSRQLGQSREAEQSLGHLGLGGEEALATQSDPLDEPPDEDVGPAFLHRRRGFPVELEEGLDALATLRRDLRALQGGLAGRDHVDLAAPGDRRQPRQIRRAQLDRRPRQCPSHRRRVFRVGQGP